MKPLAMAALLALATATAARAEAPATSPHPVWRPVVAPADAPALAPALLADLPAEVPDPSENAFAEVSADATALAPDVSPHPQHRPEGDGVGGDVEVTAMAVPPLDFYPPDATPGGVARVLPGTRVPRPKWRPEGLRGKSAAPIEVVAHADVVLGFSVLAVESSRFPRHRPKGLGAGVRVEKAAAVRVTPAPAPVGKDGSVCGLPGVKGTALSPITSTVAGCGLDSPVKITSVDGLKLTAPAVIDCTTAAALSKWVRGSVIPAYGKRGGGVVALRVAASYSCRPRNNQKGAKIASEHGQGHAIDISGFILKNGVEISVLKGWRDATQGKILKALHKGACGTFGTVLGPTSDKYHQDHLHLDTARYRSGSYCR